MYQTIRDIMASGGDMGSTPLRPQQQQQQMPTGKGKPAAKKGMKPGEDEEQVDLDTLGQEKMQMPQHEVNVDSPTNMHAPQEAQSQFSFLKQAMGGPPQGFVTKTPNSHAMAQKLARSGHLIQVGEQKLGNNHLVKHWQMSPKGVAALGQTNNKAGARRL